VVVVSVVAVHPANMTAARARKVKAMNLVFIVQRIRIRTAPRMDDFFPSNLRFLIRQSPPEDEFAVANL
jgi:hypothetical protein